MGLAMVQGIVRRHDGAITVHSQLGEGSTFSVFLPHHEQGAIREESEDSTPLRRGNERVLLVDDEEALVQTGQRILEFLGYQVSFSTSSIEALEVFRAQTDKYDLVITDQTMPRMTGMELAQKLIDIRPDIPIILCTGYNDIVSDDKAKEIGIRELVLKPLLIHSLAETIRKVLDDNGLRSPGASSRPPNS